MEDMAEKRLLEGKICALNVGANGGKSMPLLTLLDNLSLGAGFGGIEIRPGTVGATAAGAPSCPTVNST
jgi:hypothetical protein